MAQRGGRGRDGQSAWQQHHHALQREAAAHQKAAEQAARAVERKAREDERQRKQAHAEAQAAEAERKTAALAEKIRLQETMLVGALSRPPASFDSLRRAYVEIPFNRGSLGTPIPPPDEKGFLSAEPRGLARLLKGRHERELQAGLKRYNDALAEHRQQEQKRLDSLARAMAAHTEKTAIARAQIEEYNAKVTQIQQAFNHGVADAVEWLVLQTLNASPYPNEFPRKYQVAYRPENRDAERLAGHRETAAAPVRRQGHHRNDVACPK